MKYIDLFMNIVGLLIGLAFAVAMVELVTLVYNQGFIMATIIMVFLALCLVASVGYQALNTYRAFCTAFKKKGDQKGPLSLSK